MENETKLTALQKMTAYFDQRALNEKMSKEQRELYAKDIAAAPAEHVLDFLRLHQYGIVPMNYGLLTFSEFDLTDIFRKEQDRQQAIIAETASLVYTNEFAAKNNSDAMRQVKRLDVALHELAGQGDHSQLTFLQKAKLGQARFATDGRLLDCFSVLQLDPTEYGLIKVEKKGNLNYKLAYSDSIPEGYNPLDGTAAPTFIPNIGSMLHITNAPHSGAMAPDTMPTSTETKGAPGSFVTAK